MLNREELEAFLNCNDASCGDCPISAICEESNNISDDVARTALELMDKLAKAIAFMKSCEICLSCVHNQTECIASLPSDHVCVMCTSMMDGDLWVFNESLLDEQ